MAASSAGRTCRPLIHDAGLQYGLIPQSEALDRYALSEEEFLLWRTAVERHGDKGLKVTAIQKYRQL